MAHCSPKSWKNDMPLTTPPGYSVSVRVNVRVRVRVRVRDRVKVRVRVRVRVHAARDTSGLQR